MELQMISPQTASRSHPLLPQICMPWLNAFRMTRQCRSGYLPMPNNYEKKKTAHPQHNADNRRSPHIQIFNLFPRTLQQLPDLRDKQIERNIVLSAVDNDIGESSRGLYIHVVHGFYGC